MTEENIIHIRKTLTDLEAYCREAGFKCSYGFGGGSQFSGGIMEWDEENKTFNQITEQKTVRQFSNLSFKVTIRDTDYGDDVNMLKDAAKGISDMFRGLPNSEDFENHPD